MAKKTYKVADEQGFHARPTTLLVQECSKQDGDVNIIYQGRSINAKSMMGVLSLGIKFGHEFDIEATDVALEAIENCLKTNNLI